MNVRTLAVPLACFAIAQTADAVSLSQDGRGQVLIYPYYTTRGTNDTLFSIANSQFIYQGSQTKAVKVRFREHRNSRPVADFNVYLAPGMVFTAMITRDANGHPVLRTQSPACTVPRFTPSSAMPGWTELPFSNAAYAGYDQAGSGLERATEGFFEAIEMGEVDGAFTLPGGKNLIEAITYAAPNAILTTQDCNAVANAWASGGAFLVSGGSELKAPEGGLFGMGSIINVAQGSDYSFDPVVLSGFSTTKRHTSPGSASPNLWDADPVSVIVTDNTAYTSTWDNGRDAVSAVLAKEVVFNEYIAKTPQLDAATDVILTYPTKGLHVVRESDTGQSSTLPFSAEFDDVSPAGTGATGARLTDGSSQGACEQIYMRRYANDGRRNSDHGYATPTSAYPLDPRYACWSTSVFSFGNVLDSQVAVAISDYAATPFGWIEIRSSAPLTSKEGRRHIGLPVIGFSVEKYVNGNLNGVLSNYGGTLAHKYSTVVE